MHSKIQYENILKSNKSTGPTIKP